MRHKQIDITFEMFSVEQLDYLYGFHSRANKLACVSCCFGMFRVSFHSKLFQEFTLKDVDSQRPYIRRYLLNVLTYMRCVG